MYIDSRQLIQRTFGLARASRPETEPLVTLLMDTLAVVKQRRSLIVKAPAYAVRDLPKWMRIDIAVNRITILWRQQHLTPANQPFFALSVTGAQEIQRLFQAEYHPGVRGLGYALHNLAWFLRRPEDFDRDLYLHCFEVAGAHWQHLSPAMRQALCDMVGFDRDAAIQHLSERKLIE